MNGNSRSLIYILLGFAILLVGYLSVFTVQETERAIVLNLGKPVRSIAQPGLNFKYPLIETVLYFDDRVLDFDASPGEIPTKDQKQVVVDAFARYRIVDPLEFFRTARAESQFRGTLNNIMGQSLRAVIGEVQLEEVLTERRATLMADVARLVGEGVKSFGVEIIDVRIKRVDLPDANSQAVFRRMQTQREQEARKFRAEGQRDANFVRAEADRQVRVLVAEAQKRREILRGEADAEATKIYAGAYGRDPAFFDFYRSLQAMRRGLDSENTRYIGPPDGDFFRFFGSGTLGRNGETLRR
ncbi:MAG: protease modulator HflC [Alphaproteobacteria bacterium]